jgi:ribonucleoside-diphosphate reductase alpha chain
MKVFNAATEAVKQGGTRRGANLGLLRVDHPDILEFIACKEDDKEITNFNISVGLTDDFMKAVRTNSNYDLVDPHTGKVTGKLPAKEVFDTIVDHAWRNGEPGMIFMDRVNQDNPTPHVGEIEATNPCVTGDTLILTSLGYRSISSLIGTPVSVWNGFEWSEVIPEITGHNQDILDIQFSDGNVLSCTPYHGFVLSDHTKVKAKDLQPGDPLLKYQFPVINNTTRNLDEKMAYTMGVFCGDGSIETGRNRKSIWLYGDKKDLLPHLVYESVNACGGGRLFVALPRDAIYFRNKQWVPEVGFGIETRLNWLAGLIDTDGTLNSKDGAISISSIHQDFLLKVKLMLNTLGVSGVVALCKEAAVKLMPDGTGNLKEYPCQDCYRLIISASNVKRLRDLGLNTHRVKLKAHPNRDASRFVHVVSVTPRKEKADKVYCFNEPLRHLGCFNGIVTAQCGEQPLLPNEACNLGSINLKVMVQEENGKRVINWNRLQATTRLAVRFLDNVIDANQYPLPVVQEMVHGNRKIGLGVMGFADLLTLLKVSYASDEAVELAEKIMSFIQEEARKESERLAVERGVFPNYEGSVYDGVRKLRNATLTTIAPTGTISMICGTSSGVEPVEPLFAVAYTKTVLDGTSLTEVNPIFEDYARQYGFYSEELMQKIAKQGTVRGLTEVPAWIQDLFATAHEIEPEWHIRIQSAFQKYTDNAVSKTINLNNAATHDDVAKAYFLAYKLGCKGLTVYRNGSREEQVMTTGTTELTHCPECGAALKHEGGCATCPNCGYSVCHIS